MTEFKDMTAVQRMERRRFWLAWSERAQQALGALLAETIGEEPAVNETVYGCVNQLIDVEQQLSAVVDSRDARRGSVKTPSKEK